LTMNMMMWSLGPEGAAAACAWVVSQHHSSTKFAALLQQLLTHAGGAGLSMAALSSSVPQWLPLGRGMVDNECSRSLLHIACEHQREDCVRVLLGCRADPNASDRWGGTALITAAHDGAAGLISQLLSAKADVLKEDDAQLAALSHICDAAPKVLALRFVPALQLLLDGKADVTKLCFLSQRTPTQHLIAKANCYKTTKDPLVVRLLEMLRDARVRQGDAVSDAEDSELELEPSEAAGSEVLLSGGEEDGDGAAPVDQDGNGRPDDDAGDNDEGQHFFFDIEVPQ